MKKMTSERLSKLPKVTWMGSGDSDFCTRVCDFKVCALSTKTCLAPDGDHCGMRASGRAATPRSGFENRAGKPCSERELRLVSEGSDTLPASPSLIKAGMESRGWLPFEGGAQGRQLWEGLGRATCLPAVVD